MTWQKVSMGIAVFLSLVLLGLVGIIQGQDGKSLVIVFTTDTNGELNPCG